MGQLGKYCFANAKIRAMLSQLVQPVVLEKMCQAADCAEALELLRQTPYAPVLPPTGGTHEDMRRIERALVRCDIQTCRKVHDILSSKPEKEFILLLLQRYEIEELKVFLRLWHRKTPVIIEDFLIQPQICFEIDFQRLIAGQSIEELILLLDHTPYKQALMRSWQAYKQKHSVFYLEAALDLDYYQRLNAAIERFSSVDRGIARRIMGIEIDIQNINWLIRLRKYYSLGIGEMLEWFVPGGAWITKEHVRGLYVSDGLGTVAESVSLGPYAPVKELIEDNPAAMEPFLYAYLGQEVRKALGGFPFTIGTVLGYLMLQHRQTQTIVSVLNAKQLGWRPEQIVPLVSR